MTDGPVLDATQSAATYRQLFVDGITEALDRAPKPFTALDFACGDGFCTRILYPSLPPGSRVIAISEDRAALKAFHNALDDALRQSVFLRKESYGRLPFDEDAFDLAWCSLDTHRLAEPRVLIRQVMRSLRAPGQLLIATPLRETLLALIRALTPLFQDDASLRSLFEEDPGLLSAEQWTDELVKMGGTDVGVAQRPVRVVVESPISNHHVFTQLLLPLWLPDAALREKVITLVDGSLTTPIELTVPIGCVRARKGKART